MLTVNIINHTLFPAKDADELLSLLPSNWKNEILKFKCLNDRKSRLLAKVLLLNAIADSSLFSVDYKKDRRTKPYVENWHPFNISHSNELTIICYSDTSFGVGIDIEFKKEIDFIEISQYFHEEEKEYIKLSPDPLSAFYEVWTRKEAVLKAHGTGIINGLDNFSCLTDPVYFQDNCYLMKELEVDDAYACSVAVESNIEQQLQVLDTKNFNYERIKRVCDMIIN